MVDPQSMAAAPRHAQPSESGGGTREQAKAAAEQAKSSASEVAGTAQEQVREVTSEAKRQARNVASDVRDRLGQEAEQQSERAADMLARWSDDLAEMAGDGDTPARAMARQLSDKGREFADQLRSGGPDDVLNQVRDFARRRPGAFLLGSAAAGFIAGRLGKSLTSAGQSTSGSTQQAGQQAPAPPVESADPAYTQIPDQAGRIPATADARQGPVRR